MLHIHFGSIVYISALWSMRVRNHLQMRMTPRIRIGIKSSVLHERVYENDGDFCETWQYSNSYRLQSDVTWSLTRALKSNKLLPFDLHLEFPAVASSAGEANPPSCVFHNTDFSQAFHEKCFTGKDEWNIAREVSCDPYSSTHVCAILKTCTLRSAVFHTELRFSGKIQVTVPPGKGSKKKGVQHIEDIVCAMDALGEAGRVSNLLKNKDPSNGTQPSETFTVLESLGLDTHSKQLCFRFEGLCSGMLATDVDLVLKNMESTL